MYTIPPKKMVIINILDILKKYSDMDHRLTQAQIIEILKKEYYMDVDRRTVKRNLMNLLDFDFGIDYTEIIKKNEKGEEIPICTDWYITREFDDSEIRLLIDSVLFSKTIPQKQCKKLIDKLKGLIIYAVCRKFVRKTRSCFIRLMFLTRQFQKVKRCRLYIIHMARTKNYIQNVSVNMS